MRKNKMIALIIMAVIFLFPFRVAFLEVGPDSYSNTMELAMFLVTLFGSLLAVIIGSSEEKKGPEEQG